MSDAAGEGTFATASPLTSQMFNGLPRAHCVSFSVRQPNHQRPRARRWGQHLRDVWVRTQRFTCCGTSGY